MSIGAGQNITRKIEEIFLNQNTILLPESLPELATDAIAGAFLLGEGLGESRATVG